jgi:tetratricopeptide (TPR) repeat protein
MSVEADPDFAMGHYYWALTAVTPTDFQERLARAVELAGDVTEPERFVIMSTQANNEDNAALAREHLEQVVALLPDGKRAHTFLGNFLFGQQQWDAAEAEYRRVIEIDPSYAPVYNQLGYLLTNLERYSEAIEALQKYSELKPEDPNPHDSMGEIYLWSGDHENSVKEFSRSLELDPNFIVSIAGIGHNYVFQGEFEKARAKYDEILQYSESVADTTTAFFWKAVSYLHENKYDEALGVLGEWLKFAEARNNITQTGFINGQMAANCYETGDYDKAMSHAAKAREIAVSPEVSEANREAIKRFAANTEAMTYARQGKMDEANGAVTEYWNSAEASGNQAVIMNAHTLKGVVSYWSEDYQKAIEEFGQASSFNPYSNYYLGLSLEGAGQTEAAAEVVSGVASFNRNSQNYGFVRPAAMARK